MKIKGIMLFLLLIVQTGCVPKVNTQLALHNFRQLDFYEEKKKAVQEDPNKNILIGDCFDISEKEAKESSQSLFLECLEIGAEHLPPFITLSEYQSFLHGVNDCFVIKVAQKYKNKFTYDKKPEKLEHCKGFYEIIKTYAK